MIINKEDITKLSHKSDGLNYYEFSQKIMYGNIKPSKEVLDIADSVKLEQHKYQKNNFYNKAPEDVQKGEQIFNHFKKFFQSIIERFGYNNFVFEHWWLQKYNPLEFIDVHTHGSSLNQFSYIIYLRCSENSGKTLFYLPGYPYIETQEPLPITPKAGLCLFFPSYLPHSVEPNNDDTRLIMSGNVRAY